jgi:hypothetical protein
MPPPNALMGPISRPACGHTFGCRAHHSRGEAICPNGLTISEKKLNAAVFDALRGALLSAGAFHHFVEGFNRELARTVKKPVLTTTAVKSPPQSGPSPT